MNPITLSLLVSAAFFVLAALIFYNLHRQVNKQIYDQNGEYMGQADEPNDNKQVTSVPEKQIKDLEK